MSRFSNTAPRRTPAFAIALWLAFSGAALAQFGMKSVVLMEGIVMDETTLNPIGASVDVLDPQTHAVVNSYRSNAKSGAFSIVLKPSQHFIFRISSKGYFTTEEEVRTPSSQKYEHITHDFALEPSQPGSEIPMVGRLFEFKKSELAAGADEDLADLERLMQLNPEAKISVVSYPDQTANPQKNLSLTASRADAVKNYLVSHGIAAQRIRTAGNESPDSAAKSAMRRYPKGKHPVGKVYIRVIG